MVSDENLLDGIRTPRDNNDDENNEQEYDSAMSTPMFNKHLRYDSRSNENL
jgi:hypothetical protein